MTETAAVPPADAPAAETVEETTTTAKGKKGGAKGKAAATTSKAASTTSKKKATEKKPAAAPTRVRPAREIKKPGEPGASLAIPSKPRPKQPRKETNREPRTAVVAPIKIPKNRKLLAPGTIVWAKLTGYPWYPATIVEDSDKSVPAKVKSAKPENAARDKAHLFKFTGDKGSVSWGWAVAANLQTFNESADLDAQIIKNQRYKTAKERRDVRTAHRRALAELEAAGGEEGLKAKAALAAADEDKMDEDAPNGDAA